ncbi:MAG: hypothetical protein ABIF77_00570 [bacterium]
MAQNWPYHKYGSYHQISLKTVGGMVNRQVARDLGVDPARVDRKIERLG